MKISKKRMEQLLQSLVSKRMFYSQEGSDSEAEFDELVKCGFCKKKKDKHKSTENCVWYIYNCTTKAEKTYEKIRKKS